MSFHNKENCLKDLNNLKIENGFGDDQSLDDYSFEGKKISVYFKDIEKHIVNYISKADAIVGCVAWMTSRPILKELLKKEDVKIIIQKEDFLRPDGKNKLTEQNKELRELYDSLKYSYGSSTYSFYKNCIAKSFNMKGDVPYSVRCMGSSNSYGGPYRPRMHNKFIIFGKIKKTNIKCLYDPYEEKSFDPYAVWTGSFNFTSNAGHSFENGLYITDKKIVMAYYKEWAQILGLSEELDWETPWVAPTVRIGS